MPATVFRSSSRRDDIRRSHPPLPGNRECIGGRDICDFDLAWSETAGQHTALSIAVDGYHDNFGDLSVPGGVFGLKGGVIATDDTYFCVGSFSGCSRAACSISGFWTDAPAPAPEPGTLALLGGLLGAFGLARRRRG